MSLDILRQIYAFFLYGGSELWYYTLPTCKVTMVRFAPSFKRFAGLLARMGALTRPPSNPKDLLLSFLTPSILSREEGGKRGGGSHLVWSRGTRTQTASQISKRVSGATIVASVCE